MKNIIVSSMFVLGLLALRAYAEDIDLFVGVPPQDGGNPNVLIVLDNSANWNTAFENEMDALVDVFEGLDPNNAGINVGLMMYGEAPQMGYVRAAIRDMAGVSTHDDPENPGEKLLYNQLYADMIGAFEKSGSFSDSSNNNTLARTFSEVYMYLTGSNSVDTNFDNGYGKNTKRDHFGNADSKLKEESLRVVGLPRNALSGERVYTYTKPEDAGLCANTYVIFIGNNVSSGNVSFGSTQSNTQARGDLFSVGGSDAVTQINYATALSTTYKDSWADEWAQYMHNEMGVIFYALDVDPTDHPFYNDGSEGHANGMANSELIRSLSAGVGGGRYIRVYSDDSENIKLELNKIIAEIQAENSVFASVALPASSAGQSVFLNQVFIGLFRPDGSAYPKWPGNLKQYRLGKEGGSLQLVDASDSPQAALNPSTGFITECARSYWTPSSADSYWTFSPQGTCPPATELLPSTSNSPDGPYVEKGGQAYTLRNNPSNDNLRQNHYSSRVVYTCDDAIATCNSDELETFNKTNTDQTAMLAADSDEHGDIVDWARGKDIYDVNKDETGDYEDTRAYVHGDVIHSRPIALNYGTKLAPEVVVYYGANDGMLRAVSGNQSGNIISDANTYAPGEEMWAFMPPEFWPDIKRLMLNTEQVKIPATGTGSAGRPGSLKDYGMDGPITAWEDDSTDPGTKYIYAGMRRGGRALYAFDVSVPAAPDLLWKIGCDDSGTCSDLGWSDLGQTWSPANVAFVSGRTNPVLIMGGGYDNCEDFDGGVGGLNHSCTTVTESGNATNNLNSLTSQKGNHIYVIDAVDGTLLATFDTERAVPGGVTIVPVTDPTEANPTPDIAFAYAADTGGNVYRISGPDPENDGSMTIIGSNAPNTWEMTLIASLGCGTTANGTSDSCSGGTEPNRKFLFGVDVVRKSPGATEYRILAGTGDREKPLKAYGAATDVQNYFYSFEDQPLVANWLDVSSDCGVDVICQAALQAVGNGTADGSTSDGVTPVDGISTIDPDKKGYAFAVSDEEQVVSSTLVVSDTATFSTHIPYDPNEPEGDVCVNKLGTATTYNIDFEDASGDKTDILTGGLVPSPVAGKVEICEDGVCAPPEEFCFSCGDDRSPIGAGPTQSGASFQQSKGKVFWKIKP